MIILSGIQLQEKTYQAQEFNAPNIRECPSYKEAHVPNTRMCLRATWESMDTQRSDLHSERVAGKEKERRVEGKDWAEPTRKQEAPAVCSA